MARLTGKFIVLLAFCAGTAWATPPHYSIERLGFYSGDYVASSGYVYSYPTYLNEQGQVAGTSARYSGAAANGQDVWLYTGSATILLGYTGAGYEKTDGYRRSEVVALNDQGHVLGNTDRYSGTSKQGEHTWLYNGTNTVRLGLTGPDYRTTSPARLLNNQGQVAGYTFRNDSDVGNDAWLYTGTDTIQVGFTGPGYEKSYNGHRASYVHALNNQGQVGGYSNRYSGNTYLGNDAWLYTGTSTIQLGFTGPGYERDDGYRSSGIRTLSDQGQAAGVSNRYSGSTALGVDAWLYTGTGYIGLGLTGPGYEQSNGYRVSTVVTKQNSLGQLAGHSTRYSGSTSLGNDAWLYNGAATIRLGLDGADYQKSDGHRESYIDALNDQGQVIGSSVRVIDGNFGEWGPGRGRDAWLYTGTSIIRLGFTSAGYETSDGTRNSRATALNDAGQAVGYSVRYGNTISEGRGQDAWFYDANLNQTFNLRASERPSDGFAYSNVRALSADGVAVGYYELYDQTTGASLGQRAFYFSLADGFQDLGPLVGDLTEAGWPNLAIAHSLNARGHIVGTGTFAGETGQAAYMLKPALQVQIDVEPWSTENLVRPDSTANISVAVLGHSQVSGDAFDFDVATIDPATLKLGPGEAPNIAVAPLYGDYDSDSNTDAAFVFKTQDTGIFCEDTEVTLTGATFSGMPFEGTDTITTTECEATGCHP